MSLLARINDYEPGNPIISSQVDDDFNQLYDCLRGTSTNRNLLVKYSDVSIPVLDLDQLGTGLVQRWKKSGVAVAAIDSTGLLQANVIQATVGSGTAPFVVASSTKVSNLNVDFLQSKIPTDFIADPGFNGIAVRTGSGLSTARTITGTANQVSVSNGDGVSGNPTLSLPQNINTGASPTFAGLTVNGNEGVSGTLTAGNISVSGVPSRLPKNLFTNVGSTVSGTTGENDIFNLFVGAGTMPSNNDVIRMHIGGIASGATNNWTVRIRINSNDGGSATVTAASGGTGYEVEVYIMRTGATTVNTVIRIVGSSAGGGFVAAATSVGCNDLGSSNNNFRITAQPASSSMSISCPIAYADVVRQ